MTCYTANFTGVWLGGYAIIFAENEALATLLLMGKLKELNIRPDEQEPSEWKFRNHGRIEHDQGCEILWNGDY